MRKGLVVPPPALHPVTYVHRTRLNRTEQNRKTARQAGDAPEGTSHNTHSTLTVTKRRTEPLVLTPGVPPGITTYKHLHCSRLAGAIHTIAPSARTPFITPIAVAATPPRLAALRVRLQRSAVALSLQHRCLSEAAAKQLHRLNLVPSARCTPACQNVGKAPPCPRTTPYHVSPCARSCTCLT